MTRVVRRRRRSGHTLRGLLLREPGPPALAGGASLWRREEVLERHVQERRARLGERLGAVDEIGADADPPSARALDLGPQQELRVDRHRPAVAHEDARRHRGEAVPGREDPAGLVQRGRDDAAVHDPGPALVVLGEPDGRDVRGDALLVGKREVEAERVLAAPEAGRVVVRRDRRRRLSQTASLVVGLEEVLRAGGRHRRRGRDLQRERRGRHDLGEAVHLARAGAVHQAEPGAGVGERRPAADGADLEARACGSSSGSRRRRPRRCRGPSSSSRPCRCPGRSR